MKLRGYLQAAKAVGAAGGAMRLAILGGPTTTQLRQFLECFLAAEGMPVEIYEGDYGLFRQEILAPGSGLDAFRPQVIFVATGAATSSASPRSRWTRRRSRGSRPRSSTTGRGCGRRPTAAGMRRSSRTTSRSPRAA